MQSKRSKNTRGPNADELHFQAWLLDQPCCISGACGVELHHMYGKTFKHNKVLIGHWACISLSYENHRGPTGIHTVSRKVWTGINGPQCNLWEMQYMAYKLVTDKDPCPDDVYDSIMDWNQ